MGLMLKNKNVIPYRPILTLSGLCKEPLDHVLIENAIRALNTRYDLNKKILSEQGVGKLRLTHSQ
jgi:hypothetical protein